MTLYSLWLSEPSIYYAEIAYACGVRRLVLDIEHGVFPLRETDNFLAYTRARGMHTLAKVAGPHAEAIQQALDCGADGVIIPHVADAAHAAALSAIAKFPPLGQRSYSGARPVGYMPPSASYFEDESRRVLCLPMIETPGALAEVEQIAALPCVDGLFPGPTDLALTQGRGSYRFDARSQADLLRCARAATRQGKVWVMPAWTAAERAFAREHAAHEVVVHTQTMVIRHGIQSIQKAIEAEGFTL